MKWTEKKLGELLIIERGGSPRPINKYITESSDGINWIKIGDTTADSMYITSTKEKIKPEGMKKSRYVQVGDFLLSNSMSFGRPYILKIDGCIHDGWLVLRDKENVFDKRFLYYLLSSKDVYNKFKHMAVGGVVNNLNSEMVRNLTITYPTKSIQKKIVEVLDKAQELIDARKEQIRLLDDLVQSVFYDMFGDPLTNPKGWKLRKLEEFGVWQSGGTPSRSMSEYYQGNIPWVSSGELNEVYINNSKEMITDKAVQDSAAKVIPIGSLMLGMYDTAALKSSITLRTMTCNQAIAFSKLDEKICNTLYVYWCIQIGREYYRRLQRGVRQKNMNLSMIKSLELIAPDIDKQNQFSQIVQKIEVEKERMQQSLLELENNFNSLMQRAFKGKLFPEE